MEYEDLTPTQRAHIPDSKYARSLLAAGYTARRSSGTFRLVDDDGEGPYWHRGVELSPYRRDEYRRRGRINGKASVRARTVWSVGALSLSTETLTAAIRAIDAHLGHKSKYAPEGHSTKIRALAREMGADLDVEDQRHAVYRVARKRRAKSIESRLEGHGQNRRTP